MKRERRYADWRPVAVRRMPARWIGMLVGALVGIVATVLWGRPSYPVYLAVLALGTYVSNRVAVRRLEALRDEGDDRQFGATLRLKREIVYGLDEGLVAFEDGYLVYMGRRCAFSLGSGDVLIRKKTKSELEFEFKGPGGKYEAHLELSDNEGFLTAVKLWKAADRQSVESVLPPVRPDSSLPPFAVAVMNAFPTLVVGLAFLATPSKPSSDLAYTMVPGLLLVGVALLLACTQFRFLGRIARGEARYPLVGRRYRQWLKARADLGNPVPRSSPTSLRISSLLAVEPNETEDANAQTLPLTDRA